MSFNNQPILAIAHDYETTGLDIATLGLVQAALCVVTLHQDGSYEIHDKDVQLLNPGVDITAEATAIHGYTNLDVADKPAWEPYLREQMETVNSLSPQAIVGYNNKRFDDKIAHRVGLTPLRSIDLCKGVQKLKKEQGWESGKLTSVYQYVFGKPLDGGHDAFIDIQATLDLIPPIMDLAKVSTVDELYLWMRGDGGTVDMKIGFGKHKGSKLKNLDKSYVQWLLGGTLSLDPDLEEGLRLCLK